MVEWALSLHQGSKRLWKSHFESLLAIANHDKLAQAVGKCFCAPFADTLTGRDHAKQVWRTGLQAVILIGLEKSKIAELFLKGCSVKPSEISPIFLDWAFHTSFYASESAWKSVKTACEKVEKATTSRPMPLSFELAKLHLALAAFESSPNNSTELTLANVRSMFESLSASSRNLSVDFWLLWVQFETIHGTTESLAHVAWRAKHEMSAEALSSFNIAYTKVVSSCARKLSSTC